MRRLSRIAGSRRGRRGCIRGSGTAGLSLRLGGRGRSGCLGPRDVDAALEIGSVFDHNAGSFDVAHQLGVFADVDLVGGFDISVNGAQHHHFARLYTRLQLAVRSDGKAVLVQFDGAIDLAV